MLHCERLRRASRNLCRRYTWVGDRRRVGSAAFVKKVEFIFVPLYSPVDIHVWLTSYDMIGRPGYNLGKLTAGNINN